MFVERLMELCEKNHVAPSSVLIQLGFSKSSLSNWKKGVLPSIDVVTKIANYFNVSTDYLLDRTIHPQPASEELQSISDLIESSNLDSMDDQLKIAQNSISLEDKKVLELYHKIPNESRKIVLNMIEAASRKKPL